MKQVIAVVVTYNRLEKLKKCVSALISSAIVPDILVIDNCSSDGTYDWLDSQKQENNVDFISLKQNIGGAGGFNVGVRSAVEKGYGKIWLMDDDCIVHNDTLLELLQADKTLQGEYGWLSSVAIWTDGSPCLMNRQKVDANFYNYAGLLRESYLLATQATFVSLLLNSETIEKVGLPIKDFFIWGDDVEYTRRIAVRNGTRSFIVGKSIVTHEMADNKGSSIAETDKERISRYKYAYRNEGYLYRKEGAKGIGYFIAKCLLNSWRILSKSKNLRLRRLTILWCSAVKGMFFNPKVEHVCSPLEKRNRLTPHIKH